MKIAFYAGRVEFDGDSLEHVGLGGSESALINLTRSWIKNHPKDEIVVYNGLTKRDKTNFNGVIYKTIYDFLSECNSIKYDAFISLRDFEPFTIPYINASIKCLWSEDDMNEVGLQKLKSNLYWMENVDCIFGVSNYACNDIQKAFPNKKIFLLRNGYNSHWITEIENKGYNCIYTSTPFRGLDVLAHIWPRIYNDCYKLYGIKPSLKIFSGMSLYKRPDDDFQILYDKLNQSIGVILCKPIPQKELYEELAKSSVMLYPNHFLETSCMSVLEALANNVWVITTDLGALSEQVKNGQNGYTIPGNSYDLSYQEEFINIAVNSICKPRVPNSDGLIFSWDDQAKLMRSKIKEMI